MKPVEFFARDVRTCWSTTFQFDIKLFDQFLLRRLAQQPLNAVVLCDEDNLSQDLRGLTDLDRFVAMNANKRYLLRGVRLASRGRFHPKTYLFAGRRVSLLVGSGNLTRSGLDRGREVFKEFRGDRAEDVGVIRDWLSWIGELIGDRDDPILWERYGVLREAVVSSLVAPALSPSYFVTNGTLSLMQSLEAAAKSPVTELHVTAPFFDGQAEALRALATRLAPSRELHVYLGARTSVDGHSLRAVLESLECRTVVHRFEPERFVHAKLIGIISGEAGLLAVGSANLSHAALARVYSDPGSRGNCEAVVLCEALRDAILAAFQPPEMTTPSVNLASLEEFVFQADEAPAIAHSFRLLSGEIDTELRVHVRTEPEPAEPLLLAWDDQHDPLPLNSGGRTVRPLPEDAGTLVVWLVDLAGAVRSNAVVLDDPAALRAVMGDKKAAGSVPPELQGAGESSELVTLLTWAHRRFVFDIDDTSAVRRASNAQEHEADADDAAFWERYAREELQYDERSATYRSFSDSAALAPTELLLRQIQAMLEAAPKERSLRLVRQDQGETEDPGRAGHPWSFDARQQLRARNLLRRWARALGNPRHTWLGADALAINYTALVELLSLIALGRALPFDTIVEVLGEVWASLLGAESRPGVIDRVDDDIQVSALEAISEDTRQLAAGLAYYALSPNGEWQDFIYEWQPFLVRGIELGLFVAGPFACDFAVGVGIQNLSTTSIEDLLLERADYVDEGLWGERIASELALTRVAIVPHAGFKNVSLVVSVVGVGDPLHDHRIISIARRALAFKGSEDVLVDAAGERFLFRLGSLMLARIGSETRESIAPVDRERLEAVDAQGGSLADLLGTAA